MSTITARQGKPVSFTGSLAVMLKRNVIRGQAKSWLNPVGWCSAGALWHVRLVFCGKKRYYFILLRTLCACRVVFWGTRLLSESFQNNLPTFPFNDNIIKTHKYPGSADAEYIKHNFTRKIYDFTNGKNVEATISIELSATLGLIRKF